MTELKINHAAVWVSVVMTFVIGFIWYGPLFGEPWMAMVGITPESAEANSGAGMWVTNVLSSVIQMYVLAWLFTKMSVNSGIQGAMIGIIIAFAFNHMAGMTSGMFSQYPYGLAWVTGGFSMVILGIAGFILGAWSKTVE